MTTNETEIQTQLLNALKVLVLTPHIRRYLKGHDPKAFEQAERAIAAAEPDLFYTCTDCAGEIERSGISDDDGPLMLTGRTGTFYARCELCGSASPTHEVTHIPGSREPRNAHEAVAQWADYEDAAAARKAAQEVK